MIECAGLCAASPMFRCMATPSCGNPAHASSKVVRAGWPGEAPHRRQRWLCQPRNGDKPHKFSELLPRQEADASHCSECSSVLDPWGVRLARVITPTTLATSLTACIWSPAAGVTERQQRIRGSSPAGPRLVSPGAVVGASVGVCWTASWWRTRPMCSDQSSPGSESASAGRMSWP